MKRSLLHLLAILAASLGLCSCIESRQVPFDEADFSRYGGSGSATIRGTAFTILRGGDSQAASSNAVVKLMPDTAYTEEIANRHFENRVKLEAADPRFLKYLRKTNPDSNGHFTFSHLPAGKYYVSCHMKWEYQTEESNDDGSTHPLMIEDNQWIYATVSVKAGETARVEDWSQGKGPSYSVGHWP